MHQKVAYEWKPVRCTKCKGYGHETEECRKKSDMNEKKVWRPKEQLTANGQKIQPTHLEPEHVITTINASFHATGIQ